jgi:hypothetical protein
VGDNGCTLLDEVPLEGISSTRIQMEIKLHLNQVSLDSISPEKIHYMMHFLFLEVLTLMTYIVV